LNNRHTFILPNTTTHEGKLMQTPRLADQINSIHPSIRSPQDHMLDLEELRRDLAAIVADTKIIVTSRMNTAAATISTATEGGVVCTRTAIEKNPLAAVAIATLVGAGLAIALTPRARSSSRSSRMAQWVPQSLSSAHLQEIAGNLQRSTSNAMNGAIHGGLTGPSIASALERVVDSVSSIDPKTSLAPALEKASAWMSTIRAAIKPS
jgi:ElaB/YqjD/DUF883 family membrane-anchored ribosome-binding protein